MGKSVSGEEIAELVMNVRLRYSGKNRQEGAGGKTQESDYQKCDPRASEDQPEPTGKNLAGGFCCRFTPEQTTQD